MAKKSSLSKALDKRKKKSAKKGVKQVAPQSENYSSARDKKEKAKPAGYRFKGLDNFKTPTKKDIAADAGKPKSKRKTYFENRKDKSDKAPSKKFAKGGRIKDFSIIVDDQTMFLSEFIKDNEFLTKQEILKLKKLKAGQSVKLSGHLGQTATRVKDEEFELGGSVDINAHSGDSAITIQNEAFAKGGKVKKQPKWIQKAIHEDKKGALKKKAMQMGLIKNMDEKLSETDLKKLVRVGGITAQRARLAMRLRKFESGGMTDVNAHSGDSATVVQDANVLENGGTILPEDGTQADVMNEGGETAPQKPMGTLYWKGDLAEYTGKTEMIHGGLFYEIKLIEGHLKDELKWTQRAPSQNSTVEIQPDVIVEPEIEVKLETTQKATIPNFESAAYAENLIEFMGTNLEGKLLPNGDYVVLSFLFYPIWFYCAKDQKWYGNTDKYNSVTAMHISNSRPTPNAEMLPIMQLLDRMNQGIQTYDLGGVLVRQLYPMTTDNTTLAHQ